MATPFGKHDKAVFFLNFENGANLGADVSGFARNGIASAVTQTASLGGRNNVATFSAATDSGIDFTAYLGLFNTSNSLSFSGWIRLDTTSGIQTIVSASDETQGSRNIILFTQTGALTFHVRDNTNTYLFQITASGVVTTNTWYHVAFSSGPSGAKLWLNKSLIGSSASTASIGSVVTNRCQVGYNVDDDGSGNPRRELEFNGHMKDLLLSTVELNQSTVSDIYDNDVYSYEAIHLLGQSNQIGRADIVPGIDDDYSIVSGRVFQWGYNARARLAATNPLDHVNELAGDMGQWLSMCNELVPLLAYKQAIMLTPSAQGGTGFSSGDWNPGDSLYENVLTRMNQSVNYHKWSNVRCIHWMHGGTDATDGATATYQASLEAMYDDLTARATDFSVNVPFIAVNNSAVTANRILINAALAAFVADGPERYLVNATDLTTTDGVHYDAPSLRTIGTRSATVIIEGEGEDPDPDPEPSTPTGVALGGSLGFSLGGSL